MGPGSLTDDSVDKDQRDVFWMNRALALAERSRAMDEVPVGAVLVLDNELVGQGWNQPITRKDPTAHAEIEALRDAAIKLDNYRLVGTTLYVTIEPCTMCAGALIHARISRLVYGAREPRAGAIVSSQNVLENPGLNHRIETIEGVCEQACSEIVSRFFRDKRSVNR
jgi:tRNA(adenine34) deaminase